MTNNYNNDILLLEVRCEKCNTLLLKTDKKGTIEIMCRKCKHINRVPREPNT